VEGVCAVNIVGDEGAPAMVIEKLLELIEPAPLLALITVTPKIPAIVGVPERSPVALFNVSPGGKTPEARLYVGAGKPLAVNV
jgi:hypothetical protein